MKKTLLFFCLLMSVASFTKASETELFQYNKEKVQQSMKDLTHLENFINEHPDATVTEINEQSGSNVSLSASSNPFNVSGEPPLGIPSFFWGCVFGVVGVLLVAVMTDNDKAEIKLAFKGCIFIYVLAGVIYFIAIASASTTY